MTPPTRSSPTYYLLTADVGGTNSRMGLYSVDDTTGTGTSTGCTATPLVVKYYRNQEYLTRKEDGIFEKQIIGPFLQHCWETQKDDDNNNTLAKLQDTEIIACFAIAGPVRNNSVWMSNLHNIVIDGDAVAKQTYCGDNAYVGRIKFCKIINDFVAQGYGCLTLKPDEIKELNPGSLSKMDPTGPKVCVGAGTGLGECFLTPDGSGNGSGGNYTCFPSEGGHVEWSPRDDLQIKLLKYLMKKFNYNHRVSVERVVSGRGLANVYEFLVQEFPGEVDQKVQAEFETAGDMQGKVVAVNATKKGTLCEQAMQIMMSAYGCEVGSAAVKFIPTGGLYVTGGLTPKNIHFIEGQDSPFMQAYHDKGRVKPILEHVPLFAVMTEDLGVRGAHKSAQLEYEKYIGNSKANNGTATSSATSKASGNLNATSLLMHAAFAAATGVIVGMTLSRKK